MQTIGDDLAQLAIESDKLTTLAILAYGKVNDAEEILQRCQETWDEAYSSFTQVEGETEVPGGGRWNDKKRLAYVVAQNPQIWYELQTAKVVARAAAAEQRITAERISGLNRRLRILEIAVTNDFNASTLVKLGLTQA